MVDIEHITDLPELDEDTKRIIDEYGRGPYPEDTPQEVLDCANEWYTALDAKETWYEYAYEYQRIENELTVEYYVNENTQLELTLDELVNLAKEKSRKSKGGE